MIAGEGGQGVQVIAEIMAKAAFSENKETLYIPNFGVEQRGGVSVAFLTINDSQIFYPKFDKADILAILSNRSYDRVCNYIGEQTKVILGPFAFTCGAKSSQKVNLGNISPQALNIKIMGVINSIGQVAAKESLVKAMEERFKTIYLKKPFLKEENLKALEQ